MPSSFNCAAESAGRFRPFPLAAVAYKAPTEDAFVDGSSNDFEGTKREQRASSDIALR